MITKNLQTLKINKLTQEQYDTALANGTINDNELYMTPDDNELDTTLFLRVSDVGSAVDINPINADTLGGNAASAFLTQTDKNELNSAISAKAPLASPSFTGAPKVAAETDYTTAKLRNITLSTADPSSGSNGDIWLNIKHKESTDETKI